jgi:hypothetical protein
MMKVEEFWWRNLTRTSFRYEMGLMEIEILGGIHRHTARLYQAHIEGTEGTGQRARRYQAHIEGTEGTGAEGEAILFHRLKNCGGGVNMRADVETRMGM